MPDDPSIKHEGLEGLVVLPDGSTFDPGFVTRSDGSMAAEAERKYFTKESKERQDARSIAWHGANEPSREEITQEVHRQIRQRRGEELPFYRPSALGNDDARPEAYGRVVQIKANIQTTGVWTPLKNKEETYTVVIQPQNILFDGSDLDSILITMQWMVGGVTFTKVFAVNRSVIYRFPVNARKVMIDLKGINAGDPTFGGLILQVAVAIGCGDGEFQPNELSPLWVRFDQTIADHYVLLPSPDGFYPITSGFLMSAVAIAAALPAGGPFYPMFFDLNAAPVGGDVPFVVGTPLASVGDVASFDDEFVSTWAFQTGLVFAISTTADVYTAPGAGGQIRVDFKFGV